MLIAHVFALPAVFSQSNLQPVPGFPAQQVYDLLVDKKGYLWIGHELGISRYDGLSFTHFSNPNEASLGMTDLIEDRFGRIWCHNFSSQVFYLENERLHWLKAYDHTKEDQFPRMVLKGDELVVSSNQGLFVCNVSTLKSRYIGTLNGRPIQTHYIALLNDKVVGYNLHQDHQSVEWYLYDSARGLKALKANPRDLSRFVPLGYISLRPRTYKDTLYASANPYGFLLKLMVRKDSITVVNSLQTNDFINTVTRDGETLWINTRNSSSSSAGITIKNLNVSDVVTALDGNVWVSSINRGLMIERKPSGIVRLPLAGLEENDFVRSIAQGETTILMGTQNGKLIVLDKNTLQTLYTYTVPSKTSAIEVLKVLKEDFYFFNTSHAPFVIDARTKKVQSMKISLVVKDADIKKGIIFMATLGGVVLYPSPFNTLGNHWHQPIEPILRAVTYEKKSDSQYAIKYGRNDAIVYDETTQSILASYKDGLYEISSKGIKPFEFQGNKVYASSLDYAHNKLLIGTISNGLLIRQGKKLKRMSINEGLSSNSIIDTKVMGRHLWLFQSNAIQVFDIETEAILTEIDLPSVVGSTMIDVVEIGDTALISSIDGVYKVPLDANPAQPLVRTYINYVLVNSKDTLLNKDAVLNANQNDLQIFLSTPWFNSNHPIFFKYRLVGGGDEEWHITKDPIVRLPSLMPGQYRFESYAMHPSGKRTANVVTFEFEVLKPWWEQWWFRIGILLALVLGFYALYHYRVRQLMKVESIRRSISSDLHDDIGATLSSINIYTELAKRQEDNKEFLNLIQENTREIIGKLDDLVWSINPKNDSCEQLINRMRSFSEPLLLGANINYKITCSDDLHKLKLNTGIKRNVFLIFKETINNVAKHSKSKNCTVDIFYQNKRLYIQIADDGIGFDESQSAKNRNGLKNIQDRARQIKANIKIDSVKNRGTKVQLEAVV